jgi:hypothetical protein
LSGHHVGQVDWENQADGALLGRSEARAVAERALSCKIAKPEGDLLLQFDGAHVHFGNGKGDRCGVTISAVSDTDPHLWSMSLMRIAGEDWLEAGAASYRIPVQAGTKWVKIQVMLIDSSSEDALRVIIRGLKTTVVRGKSRLR